MTERLTPAKIVEKLREEQKLVSEKAMKVIRKINPLFLDDTIPLFIELIKILDPKLNPDYVRAVIKQAEVMVREERRKKRIEIFGY